MDMYIYYRVCSRNANLLQAQVIAMQERLTREYGVAAALKRRPEQKDGMHTWMEVYLAVPDSFADTLKRLVSQAGLAALIDGERHTELFLNLSPCA